MEDQNTAVATRPIGMVAPEQTKEWAAIFRKSGLFDVGDKVAPDVQEAQAMVKMLAGAEMGLQPFFAMQNLYVVKGRVFVSAAAFGALVNGADPDGVVRTKFITQKSDSAEAVIEFYRIDPIKKAWELVHTQRYTWDEVPANRKSQATYQSDRADMIFNRAMTKGAKKSCPEKVGGMRSEEESQDTDWSEDKQLIPEEPIVLAEQTPEIAANDTTPVAATKEPEDPIAHDDYEAAAAEPAEKPKRKRGKGKAKAENVPEPEAPQADQETGEIQEPYSPEASAAADLENEPVTKDQEQDIAWWIQAEKFPAGGILKQRGKAIPAAVSKANQAQYELLKEARNRYVKALAKQNGWELDEGLALDEKQRAWIKAHQGEAEELALSAQR